MTPTWKSLSLALMTVLVSACSSLSKYSNVEKPSASVTDVAIANISLTNITLNARVKVDNPNAFTLKTAGLAFDISAFNNHIAKISQPNNTLSLPANGSADVVIPITLTFANILKTAGNAADKSEVPYNIKGNVSLAMPVLGNINIPLEYSSVLPVPKLPDIRLSNVKLVKANLTSIQLQVDMLVNNPNNFAMNLNSLGFDVFMNNRSISSSKINSVALNKQGKQVVSVPLTLNLKQLGANLFAMLTSNDEMEFKVDGNANIVPALQGWKPEPMSFSAEKRVSL